MYIDLSVGLERRQGREVKSISALKKFQRTVYLGEEKKRKRRVEKVWRVKYFSNKLPKALMKENGEKWKGSRKKVRSEYVDEEELGRKILEKKGNMFWNIKRLRRHGKINKKWKSDVGEFKHFFWLRMKRKWGEGENLLWMKVKTFQYI